ncbi:MAG: ABC transporter ATP-binding protein/permease [Bacteroidaceae bacterium]|nr:ABC transporter ATP-binding protein/permease [Bacteroidaceae bacterium]
MIKYLKNRFALSVKGAEDMLRGIICSTLLNLALMLPPTFLFFFLTEYIGNNKGMERHPYWWYIVIACILFLIMFLIVRMQYSSTYVSIYDESAKRRIRLAEKLRKLPLSFFGERNLSDLTSTIMEDCSSLEQTFSHAVPQLFASFLSVIIIAISLFFFDWRMATALFWVVPLAILTLLLSRHKLNKEFTTMYVVKRGVTEQVQEGLECIQEIKSYCGEDEYNKSFQMRLKDYEKELVRHELVSGVLVNLSVAFLKLGMPSVILVGAWLMNIGELDMFVYFAFLIISAMVYLPIQEVCSYLAILAYLDVRIKRMKEIEQMPTQEGSKEEKLESFNIEMKNVNFSYDSGKQVLHDVSFIARQGEVTALVGPSGGGKSTTAKLIARFWDVNSGQILIGGKDISKIDPETLLENFAIVFQDVVLFNASIADNIRIGKRNATDEEVRKAAKMAQCDEFITRMPQGYDTIIGENGETLSGGERQRISIARALLKDAPIILLDEATASLDAENETKIQAGFSELVRNKTVIIIAHRMRTVLNADHIVVLKNGQICEEGTSNELINKNGEFAKMVRLQQEIQ